MTGAVALTVVFRTDASLQIGSGHVMRCLTLADALRSAAAECHFICREHPGNLLDTLREKGHPVHALPAGDAIGKGSTSSPAHAEWLGSNWLSDADQTRAIVESIHPDWLIVDHYALDARWESALGPYCGRLMVIDDLADRPHDCQLLLDQTLGRAPQAYRGLVPEDCLLLTGADHALLRPEFAALREYSLRRREQPKLAHLLITMGGVDPDNATGLVLDALKACTLPEDCRITVVMGARAPWLDDVKGLAATMPWPTQIEVNVADMARLMADSDLAIGAAGCTAWERCCLGLPTLMAVLAENQRANAQALEEAQAVVLLGEKTSEISSLLKAAFDQLAGADMLARLSKAASIVTDGHGVEAVLRPLGVDRE